MGILGEGRRGIREFCNCSGARCEGRGVRGVADDKAFRRWGFWERWRWEWGNGGMGEFCNCSRACHGGKGVGGVYNGRRAYNGATPSEDVFIASKTTSFWCCKRNKKIIIKSSYSTNPIPVQPIFCLTDRIRPKLWLVDGQTDWPGPIFKTMFFFASAKMVIHLYIIYEIYMKRYEEKNKNWQWEV